MPAPLRRTAAVLAVVLALTAAGPPPATAGTARALAGTTDARPLESIGGAALAAGKDSVAGFWQASAPPTQPARRARPPHPR